jgi:hypothetical protein
VHAARLAVLAGALIAAAHAGAQTTTITDTAGRTFAVPAAIRKVFAAGPPASRS